MLKTNPYVKAYLKVINEDVNTNIEYQSIAAAIGGKYIPETNTIDCKGNKVRFSNGWLNEDGSFNFKLINTSDNWSHMFEGCTKLTHLPNDFIIPSTITNCSFMFSNCGKLKQLPDNFTIPNSVIDCQYMFYYCRKLTHLPDDFTIPNNVTNCDSMFKGCTSLEQLPNNFHIPTNAYCSNIFVDCDKLEQDDPEAYTMWEL